MLYGYVVFEAKQKFHFHLLYQNHFIKTGELNGYDG